ncbi:MAG: hypothetical protein NPIRA02_02200 [Nitrospirales bacterium]|nr:MAG: hypothetical protein NPIRA02_02200 [Nitrospirales bacterium]
MSYPLSQKEQDAWRTFLGDRRHVHLTRRHLFDRVLEQPDMVKQYLSTLPEEQIQEEGLLRKLQKMVTQ